MYLELLRMYFGITQELLRNHLGITQDYLFFTQDYLGITQELLRNYLDYLGITQITQNLLQKFKNFIITLGFEPSTSCIPNSSLTTMLGALYPWLQYINLDVYKTSLTKLRVAWWLVSDVCTVTIIVTNQNTQELLRNYLGITQDLLRNYLGITQRLLRTTYELLRLLTNHV